MAIDLSLHDNELPHDETVEETFERALLAWRVARARMESVDPRKLSPAGRAAYYRTLARIGLWADARACAEPEEAAEAGAESDALSADELRALTVPAREG